MNVRKAGCLVVSSLLLLSDPIGVRAQQPNNAFGEVFDVRVTNVDVHATDSKGNPIAGLTKADFEIYEDGKKQEITNFYEMTAAQTSAAATAGSGQYTASSTNVVSPTARKYIFYVDNGTLSLKNRSDIFAGITDFMQKNLLPGDQVMIVNWNGDLHIRLPWSSDRNAIESTLKTLSGELGSSAQFQAEKQRAIRLLRQMEAEGRDGTSMTTYDMVESAARSYAESVRHDISQSVAAMTKLLSSLSGVEGKKVLIMATEALPTQAGAEMFQALSNIRTRSALDSGMSQTTVESSPGGGLSGPLPGASVSQGAKRATAVADLGKYNVTPMIEGLARAANATGVTVYAINPKGMSGNAAGKADQQESSETEVDFAESAQIFDGVNLLTKRTGGVATIGAPAAVALASLTRDLGSYYSIGYRSGPGKSPERKIEVRVKRPGVTARYRGNIYYRSLQTEMADRVIANHLQSQLSNDLGITLQTQAVEKQGADELMPMMVIIPADSLTMIPDAEGNVSGGFSVFTSTGDADGNAGGVNVQSQQLKWPKEQVAQMKGRRIGFAVKVPMDKNPKQVSVGVVDQVSQVQGFATIKIAK
jgi:VWFA-related protein